MIIVRFQGGIGNQLFQYALYRKLRHIGKEVYADLNTLRRSEEIRSYELDKLGLSVEEAPLEAINKIYPRGNDIVSKIARNSLYRNRCIKERDFQKFDPVFLNSDNVFLSGYWQNEKYFEDIGEDIYQDIEFRPINEKQNEEMLKKIHASNSVSVHIRLGDYINNPLYIDICTKEYYLKAIELIENRLQNVSFFIISDNISEAHELLGGKKAEYIGFNKGDASYYDMYLISQCKHHIMANSSFSWWGVWMDRSSDNIVIAPSIWEKGIKSEEIWKESWNRISPEGEVFLRS